MSTTDDIVIPAVKILNGHFYQSLLFVFLLSPRLVLCFSSLLLSPIASKGSSSLLLYAILCITLYCFLPEEGMKKKSHISFFYRVRGQTLCMCIFTIKLHPMLDGERYLDSIVNVGIYDLFPLLKLGKYGHWSTTHRRPFILYFQGLGHLLNCQGSKNITITFFS